MPSYRTVRLTARQAEYLWWEMQSHLDVVEDSNQRRLVRGIVDNLEKAGVGPTKPFAPKE